MLDKFLNFRYLFLIAIVFLLINSFVFLLVGAAQSIQGYIEFINIGFTPSDTERPGVRLLEGLDFFMIALIFMVFGLGMARLFFYDKFSVEKLPQWLQISNVKELKVLLWETILLTLVIFNVTHLIKNQEQKWELMILPGVILILSLALYFMRHDKHKTG